jgi:hypothetical protein
LFFVGFRIVKQSKKKKLTDIGFCFSSIGFLQSDSVWVFPGYCLIDCYQSTSDTKVLALRLPDKSSNAQFSVNGFYHKYRNVTKVAIDKLRINKNPAGRRDKFFTVIQRGIL